MKIPQLPEHVFHPALDEVIKLVPKTRHAKNRVRENGSTCKVIQIRDSRICVMHLNFSIHNGKFRESDAWRWIELSNDPDWDIVRMGD